MLKTTSVAFTIISPCLVKSTPSMCCAARVHRSANFSAVLGESGLTGTADVAPAARTVPITIFFNGALLDVSQTVTYKAATKAQGLGKCPAGTTQRLFITAKTTAGTGAALTAIPKGSIGKSAVCLKKDSTSVLEPGTKSTF